MATVDEILTRQAYAAEDETWTKDNNYPSYTMYAEPEYVPVTNKRIADFNDQVSVRGEQNAQFVGFQLPRYDDAMDLTKQNLYIHYQTVYGGSDGVPCNVSWSANYVRMCWKIPGQATQEPGSIQMMIYATGTDSVGDRTIWKTLPATYTIHDGLEIGGGIPEPDPSWYEQFVAQMEGKVSTAQGYANDAQASKTAAAGSATAAAQSADASAQALAENKDYVESQKETFVGYNKRETDLKYANALIGSASGTGRVTVGDAWEAPVADMEVAGKSDQFTTTGAQLFDASLIPALTAGGVTVEGTADGGYKISGSGNSGTFYKTVKITDLTMLKAGNIMLKSESSVPKFSVRLMDSSSTILFELTADQTRTITEEMLSTEGVYLQYMFYGAISNVTPGTYYPMLYQDGDGTWEPYTGGQPSPSPDYPQPIISTGTVTTGVQLFDASRIPNKSTGGATVTNNGDGSITISGTGAMTGTLYTPVTVTHEDTMALIGDERVFTAAANIATYPYFFYEFWDKNGVVMRLLLLNVTSVTKSLPTEADMDTLYIQTGYYGRADESIVAGTQKVMVNAGSTALPWQPYQSCTATIPLTAPLYGIGEYRDRIMCKDGEWGIERYCPTITFDGSTDEKWNETNTNDATKKRYNCKVSGRTADLIHQTALCSHFPLMEAGATFKNVRGFTIANDYIQVYLHGRPLEEFKTWLQEHPITLVYQLDTPTWTPLPAATQSALNALTTYTGTTHVTITAGGPEPDVAVEYVQDTKAVIADIMAQIDTIRNGGTT